MNFTVKPVPHIRFGAGALQQTAQILHRFGQRVLILTGAHSFERSPEWGRLSGELQNDFIICHARVSGEPSPESVDAIVDEHRSRNIESVLAIGGGSVLDCGKAVSVMLAHEEEESVEEYLEGVGTKTPPGRKVPFIAVPTTAGTGSEMTANAVISRVGRDGFKKSLRHDNYVPDIAIVDPKLTMNCPQKVTVNCAMDAFTQLVESYLSTNSSVYTDDLALGALRLFGESLEPLCAGGNSLYHRTNIAYGAMISGITLANAGLGVVHGFASEVGAMHDIPHGVVCATLMGAANQVTLEKLRKKGEGSPALAKYAKLGRIYTKSENGSDEHFQDAFIDHLHTLAEKFAIPRMGAYGFAEEDLQGAAERSGSKNNPVELNTEEKLRILTMRL